MLNMGAKLKFEILAFDTGSLRCGGVVKLRKEEIVQYKSLQRVDAGNMNFGPNDVMQIARSSM